MNPLVLPPDEKEMGLLPSLPPFETVIEWATWMTLWVGVGGMTCLLMGWAVLRWRSRSVGWLAGAQWANRLALIAWCLGLMIAVAAPVSGGGDSGFVSPWTHLVPIAPSPVSRGAASLSPPSADLFVRLEKQGLC